MARLVTATAELVRRSLHMDVEIEIEDAQAEGPASRRWPTPINLQQVLVNLALNARELLKRPNRSCFACSMS